MDTRTQKRKMWRIRQISSWEQMREQVKFDELEFFLDVGSSSKMIVL